MAEYIDKAALLKSFDETIKSAEIWRDDCKDLGVTAEFAERAIIDFNEAMLRVKDFPSVDAVNVILCKDCRYSDGKGSIADGRYWCVLHQSFMYYCSDAERKKDG